jgi:nicotinic acid mononucleotide adenylyltransferase
MLILMIYNSRVNMCTLAVDQTSAWLMVDAWEAFKEYQRTAVVLDHFDYEINTLRGGVQTADGEQRSVRVMLLAGSDLISTMSEPGVWSFPDVSHDASTIIPQEETKKEGGPHERCRRIDSSRTGFISLVLIR